MKTILLIEDDPLQVELFRATIQGYKIVSFPTGPAALSFLRSSAADLILLDNTLAGNLDGIETLIIIKAVPELHNVPVFFVSGDDHAGIRAVALGAALFVGKPYSPADLLKKIEAAINA